MFFLKVKNNKKKRQLSTQLQGNTAEIKVADRKGISH